MKKTSNYFLPILIGILSLSACHKENSWIPNTTVHGIITDKCTGMPLSGVLVVLANDEPGGGWVSEFVSPSEGLRNVTTNADGIYEIKFSAYSGFNYSINAYKDGYNPYKDSSFSKGDDKEINIQLQSNAKQAELLLKIKNTNPQTNNDSISISYLEPNSSNADFYLLNSYKGQTVDVLNTIGIYGCPPLLIKLKWDVTKNNITTNFVDSVVCTAGTNNTYSINY
jgi:hypothetical protein